MSRLLSGCCGLRAAAGGSTLAVMKHCPACGAQAPRDAEHCSHCPASFPYESAAPPRPKSAAEAMRRSLPHAPPWAYALIAAAGAVLLYASFPRSAPRPALTPDAAAFDPSRDADRELADALARAKVTHRRVLLEVGGNWCLWCKRMDEFFAAHPDLAELRDADYVLVKVSVTPEQPNAAVLSRFPGVEDYPHFFVLDPDGSMVSSQQTSELEAGDGYDPVRFAGFLKSFAPPS